MGKLSIPTPQDVQDAAKSKGWTIKALCIKAGISQETFFRWRDGRHSIQVNKLQAMLDALKTKAAG
jgi:predicted transcriptional regulator